MDKGATTKRAKEGRIIMQCSEFENIVQLNTDMQLYQLGDSLQILLTI